MSSDIATPKIITISKIINALNAAFLCVIGILYFILPGTITVPAALSACYVILFGVIMLCFEIHLKAIHRIIASNFSFMFSWVGRLLFFVLSGTLAFGLGVQGIVAGAVTLANMLFNMYVMCTNPEYSSKMRRQNAEWELEALNARAPSYNHSVNQYRAPAAPSAAAPAGPFDGSASGYGKSISTGPATSFPGAAPAAAPAPATAATSAPTVLPGGWEKIFDESSNKYYYYNSKTQETSWDAPV